MSVVVAVVAVVAVVGGSALAIEPPELTSRALAMKIVRMDTLEPSSKHQSVIQDVA